MRERERGSNEAVRKMEREQGSDQKDRNGKCRILERESSRERKCGRSREREFVQKTDNKFYSI